MTRTIIFAALLLARAATLDAQTPREPLPWNSERAVELIGRAQERRAAATADTGLVNFQADARLYVYFYLDRTDTGERNLVKTDQLALEVFWQAPDDVKQRIVGWRDQKSLPTNINYHLDHLTVVLENFGDEIRLGDGDEVRGVPHPAAPGSEMFYDYLLADSLTLQLPGVSEPVRVYELRVRPKDPDRPAFLGSVFVDRRAGDLVRMDFTFTRASYIDDYLDYINISLDNGLWRGRFWLPNQQRVEIRRRIPQFDVPAGSVIRATMRVNDYLFNQPLPAQTFVGPRVVALPREQREAFPFEEELLAEVRAEGIGPEVELGEIRRRAQELVMEETLQRTGARLRLTSASEFLRYNRAEGLALNLGARLGSVAGARVDARAGFAFGAEHPLAAIGLSRATGGGSVQASAYLNRPRDTGVGPAVSGAMNTLSALAAGEDYLDLYYASGMEARLEQPLTSAWRWAASVRAERHESAGIGSDASPFGGSFRAVRPVDDLDLMLGVSLFALRRGLSETATSWTAEVGARAGVANPWIADACEPASGGCRSPFQGQFVKPQATVGWTRRWSAREAEVAVTGQSGVAFGDLPRQEIYLVGGRGTVPGHDFRAFGGDRFASLNVVAAADLAAPWIRGRLLGAAGGAGWSDGDRLALGLREVGGTPGALWSAGVGIGIFHDILRLDLVRGIGDEGRWEVIVDANPSFWGLL